MVWVRGALLNSPWVVLVPADTLGLSLILWGLLAEPDDSAWLPLTTIAGSVIVTSGTFIGVLRARRGRSLAKT